MGARKGRVGTASAGGEDRGKIGFGTLLTIQVERVAAAERACAAANASAAALDDEEKKLTARKAALEVAAVSSEPLTGCRSRLRLRLQS